ncbi:MAG: hypothetical protein U0Z44_16280 [Kouleothrix sp.]
MPGAPPAAPGHDRVALGGVLFGLATLTRSVPLLFSPLATLWLLAHEPGGRKLAIARRQRKPVLGMVRASTPHRSSCWRPH